MRTSIIVGGLLLLATFGAIAQPVSAATEPSPLPCGTIVDDSIPQVVVYCFIGSECVVVYTPGNQYRC